MTEKYINANELLHDLPDDLPYKGSVRRVLIQAPAVEVEVVKHGEWIFVNHSANYLEVPCGDTCHCSICGYEIDVAETYFKRCPMCEAKMDGGKAE